VYKLKYKSSDMEELFQEEDLLSFQSKDSFIDATVNKQMSMYLPQPTSQYYCIYCNYLEFMLRDQLIEHQLSQDHKRREAAYESLFCKICQVQALNAVCLKVHCSSSKHLMLAEMKKNCREKAGKYWDKINADQMHVLDDDIGDRLNKMEKYEKHLTKIEKYEKIEEKIAISTTVGVEEFHEKAIAYMNTFTVDDYNQHGVNLAMIAAARVLQCQYFHGAKPPFICNPCNKSFSSKKILTAHRTTSEHQVNSEGAPPSMCHDCHLNCHKNPQINTNKVYILSPDHAEKKTEIAHKLALEMVKRFSKQEMNKLLESLYPPNNDFIMDGTCQLCKMPRAKSHDDLQRHKLTNKHQKRLREFYFKKKSALVSDVGCSLCGTTSGSVITINAKGDETHDKGDVTNDKDNITNDRGDVTNDKDDITNGRGDVTNDNNDVTNDTDDITNDRGDIINGKVDVTNGKDVVTNDRCDITNDRGDITNDKVDVTNGKDVITNDKAKETINKSKAGIFDQANHLSSVEHLIKVKEYRQLIGLIDRYCSKNEQAKMKSYDEIIERYNNKDTTTKKNEVTNETKISIQPNML